jgi:hypothetical protein
VLRKGTPNFRRLFLVLKIFCDLVKGEGNEETTTTTTRCLLIESGPSWADLSGRLDMLARSGKSCGLLGMMRAVGSGLLDKSWTTMKAENHVMEFDR